MLARLALINGDARMHGRKMTRRDWEDEAAKQESAERWATTKRSFAVVVWLGVFAAVLAIAVAVWSAWGNAS